MSKELEQKQIDEMAKIIDDNHGFIVSSVETAQALYNAGYRKQNDEELIDKIATYFEKEDAWAKLKYSWNICGKSVQLRDMLRDAICGAKMKGGE